MNKSNFDFLKHKLPEYYTLAAQAELLVDDNPLVAIGHLQRLGRMLVKQIVIVEGLSPHEDEPMALLETLIRNEIAPDSFIMLLKRLEYFDVRESEMLLNPTEAKRLLQQTYDMTSWYFKTFIDDHYEAEPMYLQPQATGLSRLLEQAPGGEQTPTVIIEGQTMAAEWQEPIENGQNVQMDQHEGYQGQMWHGMKHGTGKYRWLDGTQYIGQWSRDVEHGAGVKHFANGDRYQGEWQDGFFHGKGTYEWQDGSKYEGQWQYHLEHGFGTKTHSDGTVIRGLWAHGEWVLNQDQLNE